MNENWVTPRDCVSLGSGRAGRTMALTRSLDGAGVGGGGWAPADRTPASARNESATNRRMQAP